MNRDFRICLQKQDTIIEWLLGTDHEENTHQEYMHLLRSLLLRVHRVRAQVQAARLRAVQAPQVVVEKEPIKRYETL